MHGPQSRFEIHAISDELLHFFASYDVLLIAVGRILIIVLCFRVQDLLAAISDWESVDDTVSFVKQSAESVCYVRIKFTVNMLSNAINVAALPGIN